jgi:hypothetical protein
MTKQILASDIGLVEIEDGSEKVCAIEALCNLHYNGHSYVYGTCIGGVPLDVAKKMEVSRSARIIGTPAPRYSPISESGGIENELPNHLDPAVYCVAPGVKVVGQQASVFVLRADVEAGRFNR